MLQAVYTANGSAQASSLYCRWICVERPEGARLVAVWMDSAMRAFARKVESQAKTEILLTVWRMNRVECGGSGCTVVAKWQKLN